MIHQKKRKVKVEMELENQKVNSITSISVSGFKSINKKQSIDICPLTILAGANSSGKSSIFQPLLLMKQTLEQSYDAGALLLNGAHAHFKSAKQLLFDNGNSKNYFSVLIKATHRSCEIFFETNKQQPGFQIQKIILTMGNMSSVITSTKVDENILQAIPDDIRYFFTRILKDEEKPFIEVKRTKCFFEIILRMEKAKLGLGGIFEDFEKLIRNIYHLPGLRGNPERTYPTTALDSSHEKLYLPGTFESYVASILTHWQNSDKEKISAIEQDLLDLGLTNTLKTKTINDTEVEIFVGTSCKKNKNADSSIESFVSIADVGLGVSQVLPILVALHFANSDNIVYIEQPEIHLHPRAQYALAKILANAAKRGVLVVLETHSSLLLRSIQTLVATGYIKQKYVKLHWFSKSPDDGSTEIFSADMDSNGSFGDWPEDFDDITLHAEMQFLDAVEAMYEGESNE